MVFRLEYSQEQGGFHCENEDKEWFHPENTHGWKTVAKRVDSKTSLFFTEAIRKKYPVLDMPRDLRLRNKRPSITTIRREFAAFKKSLK
jgi:hypothetical protein